MPRYSREDKAHAVARVHAGETPNSVAGSIGCHHSTVAAWVADCESAIDRGEKKAAERFDEAAMVAQRAEEIGERITRQLDEAFDAALARSLQLMAKAKLREAVGAVKIIGEQRALSQGKPTSIHGEAFAIPADATADELVSVADELRRRREAVNGASG